VELKARDASTLSGFVANVLWPRAPLGVVRQVARLIAAAEWVTRLRPNWSHWLSESSESNRDKNVLDNGVQLLATDK
jgi:hypothetical protein